MKFLMFFIHTAPPSLSIERYFSTLPTKFSPISIGMDDDRHETQSIISSSSSSPQCDCIIPLASTRPPSEPVNDIQSNPIEMDVTVSMHQETGNDESMDITTTVTEMVDVAKCVPLIAEASNVNDAEDPLANVDITMGETVDTQEPIEQKCSWTSPWLPLPDKMWQQIFGYMDLMDILYVVMADKQRFLHAAQSYYMENVGKKCITITPFKVQIGAVAYPIVRLTEMFYTFGPYWKKIYVVQQSAQMTKALKQSGQILANVNRLDLVDLRLTRKMMDIFATFLPNVQTIKMGNVTAAAKHRFDIVFPCVQRVCIPNGERAWFDFIFANKEHIRRLAISDEKSTNSIIMDDIMENGLVNMTNLQSLILPANCFRINDLIVVMQRSVSLKCVDIQLMSEKALEKWRELMPDQWYLGSIEEDAEEEDVDDDCGCRQRFFDCSIVRRLDEEENNIEI